MADLTVSALTAATLPVATTDLALVSRDGTVVNKITVGDLTALKSVAVADEGSTLTSTVASVNFVGSGVTATNTGNAVTVTIPGGSLANFTEGRSTATPNATVPVHSLEAAGAEANIDVAIVPKGTGAFALDIADNTAAGGNKRGANAIDLQTSRTAASQVASGSQAVAIGANNTAIGSSGAVAIGVNNFTDSIGSGGVAIGGGNNSGTAGVAIGIANQSTVRSVAIGYNCNASGAASFATGDTNLASGQRSSVPGGQNGTTNGIAGQLAFGHLSDSVGRYQTTLTGLRQVTTGTTATRATADAATGSATNQVVLRNNSVFKFMGRVVAYDITTLDAKEFEFTGLIKRGANAGTTALVGTPSVTSAFADAAASAWTVGITADTTNGAIAVTVTGAGANQIRWFVEVFCYETGV